ncbi:MAG: hypothetical protein V1915_04090 [Candidatus Bathyarchaeota archaeon]
MPGHTKFLQALALLEAEGNLDKAILISAASLRVLGIRVYTYFIDLLVHNRYYFQKLNEMNFSPRYELEPISLNLAGFSTRIGTVKGVLCSFRHLVQPYNIYEEVEFKVNNKVRFIKIRPHNYVRKDSEEAIEKMIQGSNEKYWQDLYSYHKQIEAIDLGLTKSNLKFGSEKYLKLEG